MITAIQASRKTNENTIEAALSESAMETQKIQQDAGTNVVSTVRDFRAFNSVTTPPIERRAIIQSTRVPSLEPSRRKRKSSLRNNEEIFQSIKNGRATPGALIALQAKIVAESGVQTGSRCSRKDDRRNWQCPLMAKEGHTLCEHHIFLKERKKAQHAEDARIHKSEKMSKRLQEVPDLIVLSHVPKSPESEQEQEDVVADHVVEALVTLKSHVPTDAACQYLTQAIAGYRQAGDRQAGEGTVKDDEPKRTSEKLLQHLFTSAPKRRHVAAKKTAVNAPPLKENGKSTQPPAIPPLPMQYGFRRKTVKNKSLLSF